MDKCLQCVLFLNASTMPNSPNVKPCRGALRDVRNCLDIFAYAYNTSAQGWKKSKDPWKEIRDDLDEGYEVIGAFRDLIFVNATVPEIDEQRQVVLQWTEAFVLHNQQSNYSVYVDYPNLRQLVKRSKNQLSQYFWSGADIKPNASFTGLQNLLLLERALLQLALNRYAKVYNLTYSAPYDPSNATTLHAYRKLIRAFLAVNDLFMLLHNDSITKQALNTLEDLYDNLGNEEDQISAYNFYVKHGTQQQIQAAAASLASETSSLHAWLTSDVNISLSLSQLLQQLSPR